MCFASIHFWLAGSLAAPILVAGYCCALLFCLLLLIPAFNLKALRQSKCCYYYFIAGCSLVAVEGLNYGGASGTSDEWRI